jgi:hypothetical protein
LVYHGYKANLGKKHVSRQKLCLPGMQEFWVNDLQGMPYFYVTGQVNEKLQEIIHAQLIPVLRNEIAAKYTEEQLADDPDLPRFTIVFDREAYSPAFFDQLWQQHRVAVITYRKNVKDQWPEKDFTTHTLQVEGHPVKMELCERAIMINNVAMREIRRKSTNDHQTSVVTTNKKLSTEMVALHMFSRWSQENFFRYMRQDYDFDRMIQYTVDQVDEDLSVVNPVYSKLCYKIKKVREKAQRRKAALYSLIEKNQQQSLDHTPKVLAKQTQLSEELQELLQQEESLIAQRNNSSCRIKVKEMGQEVRYNKLHQESKYFQNIIKMICYRAETSFALLLGNGYKKSMNEKRALAKSVINTTIDLQVDEENKILHVILYGQPTPRANLAVSKLCEKLNATENKYPGTDWQLNYKIAT